MLAENGHNIVSHLHKATTDLEPFVGAAARDAQLAFAQQDQQWRVTAQHAQLAIPRGHDDLVRLAFEDGALRRNDRDFQPLSHAPSSLASWLLRSRLQCRPSCRTPA